MSLQKIVSGGQTGVDTAALGFALRHGIAHGGWCPRGRRRENGRIPPRYRLQETPLRDYAQRTEWNVRDSDGTVIFTISKSLRGGSRKTAAFARRWHKPLLHLSAASDHPDAAMLLRAFLQQHRIRLLNVAGPRRSEEPGAAVFARKVLRAAISVHTRACTRKPKRSSASSNPSTPR